MRYAPPSVALLAVLLVAASVTPALAATAHSTDAQVSDRTATATYAGTHVSFSATGSAVTGYTVGGTTLLQAVEVESESSYERRTGIGLGVDLASVVDVEGSAVSLAARSETRATVATDGDAEMRAHDNGNGVLVVAAGNSSQVVAAHVAAKAEARAESESRVVVTTDDGTKGTFLVVGDGEVTVNDNGDVSARLASDAKLVFRAYPDGRDDADESEEKLIASGEAAAEVHVMAEGDETVTDTVRYGENTAVEATATAESEVEVTVNRTTHEGTVVITTVSEAAVENTADLAVRVDGEAAVEASSRSDLESAIGSDQSKYMVTGQSSAESTVLVAVNHFSTRTITVSGAGESTDGGATDGGADGSDDGGADGSDDGGADESDDGGADESDDGSDTTQTDGQAGFGPILVGVAAAILTAAAIVRRR